MFPSFSAGGSEPVWPCGEQNDLVSPLSARGLWTLSCGFAHTMNETLKWLTQLPTLMQSHSGGDSVASRC